MAYYHYACPSDFPYIGWAEGEKVATGIRILSTMITISIMSSWCTKGNISSGLVHLLAKTAQGEMMRFCLLRSDLKVVFKALKFVELVSSNMLAVTNVAICTNLALIIYSHRNLTRVRSMASPKLMVIFLALSVLVTVSAVPFWNDVVVTGAHVWVYSVPIGSADWVISNQYLLEFTSGLVMTIIVLFLVVYRRPELRQVWKLHRRIQFYFGLTLIAIVADLGIGVGGTLLVIRKYKAILMIFAFSCRNIHIALDTMVLYHGLGTTRFNIEGSSVVTPESSVNHAGGRPVIDAPETNSRMHLSSGRKSSTDGSPSPDRTGSLYDC